MFIVVYESVSVDFLLNKVITLVTPKLETTLETLLRMTLNIIMYTIVSVLDSATATHAQSLPVSPPTENKYQAIKDFLILAFDLSEYEMLPI